jgi:hypothetical protein
LVEFSSLNTATSLRVEAAFAVTSFVWHPNQAGLRNFIAAKAEADLSMF